MGSLSMYTYVSMYTCLCVCRILFVCFKFTNKLCEYSHVANAYVFKYPYILGVNINIKKTYLCTYIHIYVATYVCTVVNVLLFILT